MVKEYNAILTIAYRDFLKLMRDRGRIVASLIFPIIFIAALGGALQSNLGDSAGYNLLLFTFTGVFAQTLFQSTASGVISLIEDRENDFSQEIFVSPISRYSILIGKILGETLVSLAQLSGVVAFALLFQVPISFEQLIRLIPLIPVVCLFGGAFGIIVLSNLSSQRTANQIFPFIIFPQFFLGGIFVPIKNLPLYLDILSRITPMRYAVDLVRGVYYYGTSDYDKVVLLHPLINFTIMTCVFIVFVGIGTYLFVKNEHNR